MSDLKEIRERVEESKELNGVFGPQAQDDIEYLISLVDRLGEALRECYEDDDVGGGLCSSTVAKVQELLKELEQ